MEFTIAPWPCAQAPCFLGAIMKKGQLALTFLIWCPGEDSVTQARPRLRLHAQPFESSRKVRRHLASWAE